MLCTAKSLETDLNKKSQKQKNNENLFQPYLLTLIVLNLLPRIGVILSVPAVKQKFMMKIHC